MAPAEPAPQPPAEGEELVHKLRNIAMVLRYGLANLHDAHVADDDEQFRKIHAAVKQQTELLKAAIDQASKLLESTTREVMKSA